jgi:hypothetical protein
MKPHLLKVEVGYRRGEYVIFGWTEDTRRWVWYGNSRISGKPFMTDQAAWISVFAGEFDELFTIDPMELTTIGIIYNRTFLGVSPVDLSTKLLP